MMLRRLFAVVAILVLSLSHGRNMSALPTPTASASASMSTSLSSSFEESEDSRSDGSDGSGDEDGDIFSLASQYRTTGTALMVVGLLIALYGAVQAWPMDEGGRDAVATVTIPSVGLVFAAAAQVFFAPEIGLDKLSAGEIAAVTALELVFTLGAGAWLFYDPTKFSECQIGYITALQRSWHSMQAKLMGLCCCKSQEHRSYGDISKKYRKHDAINNQK